MSAGTGRIDARRRGELLERLATERFDVLVIGGGVTGAGAALDAASRGLRVALVEARDLASGTSSRSSKLIHGGLRYLEQLDFKLVREALKERDLLVSRLAPHLVKPVSFLYPLRKKVTERPYVGAGLVLYDALEGVRKRVPHHRHLTLRSARRLAPGLDPDGLVGAMLYYDAQVDDARHTLTVARTAAVHGAVIATRTSALGVDRDGTAVTGALVRDEQTGTEFAVRADRVVICGGVWTDALHEAAGVRAGYRVRMSKGVHVVVDQSAIDADTGIILRTEKSVLFIIPWGDRWIVGTTDTDWSGERADPQPSAADVDYILEHANRVLARPLRPADVLGVYAGLRPLVAADADSPTTKLSREHVVEVPVPGLASIAGGKFTTYRVMAKDVIDAVLAGGESWVAGSATEQLPLLGADGLPAVQAGAARLAADYDVPLDDVRHLIARYGSLAEEVLEEIRADPELAGHLPGDRPYLRAEVSYAVTHEDALHLEDVLSRRTRLLFEARGHGLEAAEAVADIMAGRLGWDSGTRAAQLRAYGDLVAADTAALAAARAEQSPKDAAAAT